MKRTTGLALAFVALAGAAGGTAVAQERIRGEGVRDEMPPPMERQDDDDGGDISFEEFAQAMNSRQGATDADGDGTLTVEEIAAELHRLRYAHRAQRIIERFDANGDGILTVDEVEANQRKRFALMDRNNDGTVQPHEVPQRAKLRTR